MTVFLNDRVPGLLSDMGKNLCTMETPYLNVETNLASNAAYCISLISMTHEGYNTMSTSYKH